MPNWELTNKRIYQLLKYPQQENQSFADELHSAYDEFVEDLFNYLNKETDKKQAIRKLNTTYVEFATNKTLESTSPTDNSKIKLLFLTKIITLVDREMELILHQMEHPKFFFSFDSAYESPFYLNPQVIKIIDIMEIIVGFFNIKDGVYRHDHQKVNLKDFVRAFEKMLNVEIKDIYGKEEDVIKRKPQKVTDFLDRMKAAIMQKSKDAGYNTDLKVK